MTREVSHDRFARLIECATRVFIECGYRRAQMAEVATAMGVAKGTLYNYVESKEALFDLVARCADRQDFSAVASTFPVPAPEPGSTLLYVREQLVQTQSMATLSAALKRKRVRDASAELEAIVTELYDLLARNRYGITLIDRSARDYPALATLWLEARSGLLTLLESYLKSRIASTSLQSVPDTKAAARFILEATTFWAVHRHWDLRPDSVPESVARDTVVQFIVRALATG